MNTITEQELKDRCTPDAIKWMVELAEGFELVDKKRTEFSKCIYEYHIIFNDHLVWNIYEIQHGVLAFSTLIRRAVDGWNKINPESPINIYKSCIEQIYDSEKYPDLYQFKNYQKENLTQSECAMLDCLLDIFEEAAE